MRIWDVHAHVFPQKIAEKAVASIGGFYGYNMECDGLVDTLIRRNAEIGIEKAVIHSVAVSPRQVASINAFIAESQNAHPEALVGFGTIHALCEHPEEIVEECIRLGLHGLKIHPDMQRFALDSKEAMEMFAAIEGKLPIIIHTGDSRYEFSNPFRMKTVAEAFPRLTCICAHLGGWSEWEDAQALAKYDNIYVDTSSSLYALSPDKAASLIRGFDGGHVLFGTDYPMWDPEGEIKRFMVLPLTDAEKENILWNNAERLLGKEKA